MLLSCCSLEEIDVSLDRFSAHRRDLRVPAVPRQLGGGRLRAASRAQARAVFYGSLLVLIAAGIISAFMGHWWRQGWIWTSIVVVVAMVVGMWTIGSRHYHLVRKAVGMGYMQGMKFHPHEAEQASPEALAALLARGQPMLLATIGYGGALVIAGLMWFKPF
jgi:hypothetical protein